MILLGLDPGTTSSALVAYDTNLKEVVRAEDFQNLALRDHLKSRMNSGTLIIEQIESFGMAVGRTVFETVFWTGRFFEAFHGHAVRVSRREVKLHLCGQPRAKDGNIRQALIDRFGSEKAIAIGTKKAPGPLYGVAGHQWQALAVALTWYDQHGDDVRPGVKAQF